MKYNERKKIQLYKPLGFPQIKESAKWTTVKSRKQHHLSQRCYLNYSGHQDKNHLTQRCFLNYNGHQDKHHLTQRCFLNFNGHQDKHNLNQPCFLNYNGHQDKHSCALWHSCSTCPLPKTNVEIIHQSPPKKHSKYQVKIKSLMKYSYGRVRMPKSATWMR